MQSHGKASEKECCLPGVFHDSGDTPANLLCELNGHFMPCTGSFYGKWIEDVCAGQFGVSVYMYLVLRCYYYYDLFASRNAYKIIKHVNIDNEGQLRTPSLTNNNSSKNNTEAVCCVEVCELTFTF